MTKKLLYTKMWIPISCNLLDKVNFQRSKPNFVTLKLGKIVMWRLFSTIVICISVACIWSCTWARLWRALSLSSKPIVVVIIVVDNNNNNNKIMSFMICLFARDNLLFVHCVDTAHTLRVKMNVICHATKSSCVCVRACYVCRLFTQR